MANRNTATNKREESNRLRNNLRRAPQRDYIEVPDVQNGDFRRLINTTDRQIILEMTASDGKTYRLRLGSAMDRDVKMPDNSLPPAHLRPERLIDPGLHEQFVKHPPVAVMLASRTLTAY